MRIGQFAEVTGLDPATIRFYEAEGILPRPPRAPNGYRDYDEGHAVTARFVKAARELGFSLDDVREVLRLRAEGMAPCTHVRDLITRRIATVDRQIADLQSARVELESLRRRADAIEDRWDEGSCVCHLIER